MYDNSLKPFLIYCLLILLDYLDYFHTNQWQIILEMSMILSLTMIHMFNIILVCRNTRQVNLEHVLFFVFILAFQNDLNNRQVQISVNINNTVNINLPDQHRGRQHIRNPQRIAADMIIDESSDDDDDDDDDSEDDETDDTDKTTTDEDEVDKTSNDANVPALPTSEQRNDVAEHN